MSWLKKLPLMIFTLFLIAPCLCQMPPDQGLAPVIYLENITFSDDSPLEGEMIKISSRIYSNQSIPLGTISVRLLVDQVEVGNITGIVLDTSAGESIDFEWVAEKWTHIVTITAEQGSSPIPTAIVSDSITVEAEPIGDLNTLVSLLSGIALFIMVIVISPSIIARVRR